jgi:hypothetical protein
MTTGGDLMVARDLALAAKVRRYALPLTTLLFVALAACLALLDLELRNDVAVYGIVDFELARTTARSEAILGSWDTVARDAAMLIQGLDYLFLVVYSLWLYLLCDRVGDALGEGWRRLGRVAAYGALLCAPLDAIENHALIVQLRYGATEALAHRAWAAAVPKFVFFSAAVVFILVGSGALLARRATSRSS